MKSQPADERDALAFARNIQALSELSRLDSTQLCAAFIGLGVRYAKLAAEESGAPVKRLIAVCLQNYGVK